MLHVAKNMKLYVSRIVWECYNGLIHEIEKVVFHINRNSKDNRSKNLKLITQSEVNKIVYNHNCSLKAKTVKAINCNTKEVSYHKSMSSAAEELGVNKSSIKSICDKKNMVINMHTQETKRKNINLNISVNMNINDESSIKCMIKFL